MPPWAAKFLFNFNISWSLGNLKNKATKRQDIRNTIGQRKGKALVCFFSNTISLSCCLVFIFRKIYFCKKLHENNGIGSFMVNFLLQDFGIATKRSYQFADWLLDQRMDSFHRCFRSASIFHLSERTTSGTKAMFCNQWMSE